VSQSISTGTAVEAIEDDSVATIHRDLNADIAMLRNEAELHQARADMANHQLQVLESYRLRIAQLSSG
jgi:hypothetical protein